MKRVVIPAVLLFLLLAARLDGAAGDRALEDLLSRVEPRRGIVKRSAVLIPLVLRDGLPQLQPRPGVEDKLRIVPEKGDLVRVEYEGVPGRRLLPAGILLYGLGRERILSRTIHLVSGRELVVRATCTDLRPDDAPERTEGEYKLGPMAPHAQRKVDLMLGERKDLTTLLRVQMALAGPGDAAKTVRETMASNRMEPRVAAVARAFSLLPRTYGGAVAGHVLFIGLRPVELILFREPLDYELHAPAYLRAAAVSLVLWEEYYGVDPLLVQDVDDRLLIPVAEKVLAAHRTARVRRARLAKKERGGGDLHRITTTSDDPVMKFEGRLLIIGESRTTKRAAHLESYQDGERVVLPTPLNKPGGRPTDAKPDVSHGAMTKGFLQRLAARMASRGR